MSDFLIHIFNYFMYCASSPLHTFGCRDFWFYSLVILILICALIIAFTVVKILNERALMASYQKRLLDRVKVVDDDVLNQLKWPSDADFDDVEQIELAQQMRDNIRQRTKTNYNI